MTEEMPKLEYCQKMNRKLIIAVTSAVVLLAVCILVWFATAEGGPVLLSPPYFRLKNMYGEPFNHGWGIDLPGYGPTLRFSDVQAHTLKPANVSHSDGHMKLEDGRIAFYADGGGRCLEAIKAAENSALNANICSDSELQKWEVEGEGMVMLVGYSLCLSVGSNETQSAAGPWARRDLLIRLCDGGIDQIWEMVV
eukprot:GFUD01105790.1.p1 GENE.GFUD01105790.1~~GFUD01105790.1.p1  ORF type:complete len:195 (-),score=52.63 GFUD01105790.1:27-611(-)